MYGDTVQENNHISDEGQVSSSMVQKEAEKKAKY
jgi:hypothetical protein